MAKYEIINGEGIIPNGTTEIEDNAFEGCNELTNITIPESVTKIGNYAFYESALTSINIPNSVTTIGDDAFYRCWDLRCVTIPNSVTEIGDGAFYGCKELTNITIPESVTTIGDFAFNESALTSINIPNSVTEIGNHAFERCRKLTSITISESETKIGYHAFEGCTALTSIIVAEGNKVYDSRGNCNAIIETKTNRLIQGCTNTVIPESVTEIGECAFEGRKILTSINIPNSVTKIGGRAFSECEGLTCINIPNSVTSIGAWAFDECENLKEIILFQTDPSKIIALEMLPAVFPMEQATLYVPKEGVAAFQKDPFWSEFAAIKPITDDMLK